MPRGRPAVVTAQQFAALYHKGMTVREFSCRAGVSRKAAKNAFLRNRVPVRSPGRPARPMSNEQIAARHQDVICAVRAGFRASQIASERGKGYATVHSLIKRLSDRGLLEAV